MIEVSTCPRRHEGILTQQAMDTLLLLNLESGQYFGLEEVGRRVWDLCDGSRSVAEIAQMVSQEYEAPVEQVQADVLELLEELAKDHLVE